MYLGDLSNRLIQIAKEKVNKVNNSNVISCDLVNATNLELYENDKFDVVLLFGPLYHLLDKEERQKCIKEVFNSGKFNNDSNKGFQEGYYPNSKEIEDLFSSNNFSKISMMLIRGIGYEKEDKLYSISDKVMFDEIINIIKKHLI